MKRLLVAILVSFVFVSSAFAIEQNPEIERAYWNTVSFTIQDVMTLYYNTMRDDHVVKNGGCYLTREFFAACIEGVQSMGRTLSPRVDLIPSSYLTRAEWKDVTVLEVAGRFSLVSGSKNLKAFNELSAKQQVDEVRQSWKDLLAIGQDAVDADEPSVDFYALIKKILGFRKEDMTEAQMAVALASGFAQALDPHAHFDIKKKYDERRQNADLSQVGIGVSLAIQNGFPMIEGAPVGGGPAALAGLRAGDRISEVDGKDVVDQPLSRVIELIKGYDQQPLKLTIRRGIQSVDFKLVRAHFTRKNVDFQVIHDISSVPIGYIRLSDFDDMNGCDTIKEDIVKNEASVSGFILDLRDNPGGLLDQGVCVASLFAGQQTIITFKGQFDRTPPMMGTYEAVTRKPLVVLINGRSASAAEIVAGSLQGLKLALLVGENSFGKGSKQNGTPFVLTYDIHRHTGLYYFETSAEFYLPYLSWGHVKFRTNQIIGEKPDFTVPMLPDATPEDRFVMREGDLNPQAIPADNVSWRSIQTAKVAMIQKCLNLRHRAEAVFASGAQTDFQLLKGQEVLACQLNQ